MHFLQCAQYLPNLLNLEIVKDLQRIKESIFSDTYFTVKRAFVAILTSTYLLQFTRFTRLLRCTPSRTGYDKSSTPRVVVKQHFCLIFYLGLDGSITITFAYSEKVFFNPNIEYRKKPLKKIYRKSVF